MTLTAERHVDRLDNRGFTRHPRVAIFTETFLPRIDGIVNTLRWTLRGLVDIGWEAMVVAPSGNTESFAGVQVIGSPSVRFPPYPEVRLGYPTGSVVRQLDAFAPDIIHLAGPVTNGWGGLRYAQSRRIPVVATYHTALPEYAELYGLGLIAELAWIAMRHVHNCCAVTLCPSRATLEQLRERGFTRLALWARGVDTTLFTPRRRSNMWRERLGAGPDDVLLVYVGRLACEKKLERLAYALRRVSGVRLALVGDGPQRARLEQVFAGLPVTFAGLLRGPDLAAAYAAGDVFVFPSDTETFGNVVLEAMASGLPVITTDVGGQVDLVQHDRNGLLFAPDDIPRLAEHIQRYRDDVSLRSRHAATGLAAAAQRTWPDQVRQLTQHYRAAMAPRRSVTLLV
jgi:phosphatidylinositol alpha 1,6-mannosyltransferase